MRLGHNLAQWSGQEFFGPHINIRKEMTGTVPKDFHMLTCWLRPPFKYSGKQFITLTFQFFQSFPNLLEAALKPQMKKTLPRTRWQDSTVHNTPTPRAWSVSWPPRNSKRLMPDVASLVGMNLPGKPPLWWPWFILAISWLSPTCHLAESLSFCLQVRSQTLGKMGFFSTTVDRVLYTFFYGRLDEYAYHFAAYLIQTNVLHCCALQSPRKCARAQCSRCCA